MEDLEFLKLVEDMLVHQEADTTVGELLRVLRRIMFEVDQA